MGEEGILPKVTQLLSALELGLSAFHPTNHCVFSSEDTGWQNSK